MPAPRRRPAAPPAAAAAAAAPLLLALLAAEASALSVAVVGGGIAGASTVLDLLSREDVELSITLFEQADRIGHAESASGIIAASLIFNSQDQYWHEVDDADDLLEKWDTLDVTPTPRHVHFAARAARYVASGDPRAKKHNKRHFFESSLARFEQQLDRFPELCRAVVGAYCCRQGSRAAAWMRENGESCETLSGWAHAFFTEDDWKFANNATAARPHNWKIYEKGSGLHAGVEAFMREEGNVKGVLWNNNTQGFIRVEDLFPILQRLFADSKKVTLATGCEVGSIESVSRDAKDGLRVVVSEGCTGGVFDKVIVTAGANTVKVVAPQDELLAEELIPVKGFACATDEPLIKDDLLTLGVQHEEKSHYVRPQRNGGVRYGFGKVFNHLDDELLKPKYDEDWESAKAGIGQTGLGRKILEQKDVKKLAGMRPLSALGNFPILKEYADPLSGLVVNTGYGWHGFVMAWKSSELAVDLALKGGLDDDWAWAAEVYGGCSTWSLACWPWYAWAALAGGLLGLALLCGLGARSCLRRRGKPQEAYERVP